MKECKYCRTKYEDSLAACPNCGGTKIITLEEYKEELALKKKETENQENAAAVVATRRKLLLSALVGVVIVIIAVISLTSYYASKPLSNGMTQDEGDAILAQGLAYYESSDYESAIECFVLLPNDSKQYKEAKTVMEKAIDSYIPEVLEKANKYILNVEYEVALALIKNAQILVPENGELKLAYDAAFDTYKSVVCSAAMSEADGFAANGDYANAITILNVALSKIENDSELLARLSVYLEKYREILYSQAQQVYYENGYKAAVELLQSASGYFKGDDKFDQMIDEYLACAPILFSTIAQENLYAGDMSWTLVEKMEINGELNYFFDVLCAYGTAKYALNGEYEGLSGTFVYNGDKSESSSLATEYCSPVLNFYCDDQLTFSTTLSTNYTSEPFYIDLTGVDYLTIELKDTAQFYAFGISHYTSGITEFNIYKNVIR